MYEQLGISKKIEQLSKQVEKEIEEVFKEIDKNTELASIKVLKAFQENKVSDVDFNSSTGYGIVDSGRDKLEKIYADIFKTEDALVRVQIISGSHALAITAFGLLRPGDTFLSISGKPYDTMQTIIGIAGDSKSSLKHFGIKYEEIDLKENKFDLEKIEERVKKGNIKVIEIQRSIGYSTRSALTISQIEEVTKLIKSINKDIIIMVDNCYGEFVEDKEPTEVGADIVVGSLIKNLGGGIATSGGYVAGRKDLIELVAERLSAPGVGKEVGPTFNQNINFYKGLFLAPRVINSSLKTAVFASGLLEKLGFNVTPKYNETRSDIVQKIELDTPENLIKFCQGIQSGSPIDSYVTPVPDDMAGYDDKIIMAGGSFTSGSTIELSCDGPLREPYIAYMQGALSYEYGKFGVLKAVQKMID